MSMLAGSDPRQTPTPTIHIMQSDNQAGADPALLNLDTHPHRDRAILRAASYFLSSFPQDWSAYRLIAAIEADEDSPENEQQDQEHLVVWGFVDEYFADRPTGRQDLVDLILQLAADFITFAD